MLLISKKYMKHNYIEKKDMSPPDSFPILITRLGNGAI